MCPVLTFDSSTMKDGVDNQSSQYWLDVSSAPHTQSKHSGWETSPRKKVIAMAASVAAFGLCGSSQDVVGTEVKSSLFKKNKQKQRVWESKQHPSSRGWEPAVMIRVGI